MAVDGSPKSSLPAGAIAYAEGPGRPRRVPRRPEVDCCESGVPEGRRLPGTKDPGSHKGASRGPPSRSALRTAAESKGGPKGCWGTGCRGVDGQSVIVDEQGARPVVSFSRGAFRARLGRKLLWRAPRSVLGTAWVRWNLSSKGGVWGSLGPPSFLSSGPPRRVPVRNCRIRCSSSGPQSETSCSVCTPRAHRFCLFVSLFAHRLAGA